ncbi:hypothetical protein GGR56DRAFT_685127 [Xylariaceae sp. FL0804]|nr:hypothetical protein GGR56DRAFT_685127 [Xylariaceae sp. FL0804]
MANKHDDNDEKSNRNSIAASTTVTDGTVSALAMSPPREHWATADDWSKHRDTITSLYMEQRRPLKAVRQRMEKDHQFFATDKMFKYHFNKWGLHKNARHGSRGRDGRRPDAEEENPALEPYMHQWRADLGVTSASASTASTERRSATPDGLRMTPAVIHRYSVPGRVEAPDSLRLPEECLRIIQMYTDGYAESGFLETREAVPQLLLSWPTMLARAATTIQSGSIEHGFRMMSQCFQQYRDLLRVHTPALLAYTCVALAGLSGTDYAVSRSFLNFAVEMARLTFAEPAAADGHPVYLLLRRFARADWPDFLRCYVVLARSCVELGGGGGGGGGGRGGGERGRERTTTAAAADDDAFGRDVFNRSYESGLIYEPHLDVDTRVRVLHHALGRPRNRRPRDVHFGAAWMHACRGEFAQARAICHAVLAAAEEEVRVGLGVGPGPGVGPGGEEDVAMTTMTMTTSTTTAAAVAAVDAATAMDFHALLGHMARKEGDAAAAVDALRAEVRWARLGAGPGRTVLRRLGALEALLRDAGRGDEADGTRAEHDDLRRRLDRMDIVAGDDDDSGSNKLAPGGHDAGQYHQQQHQRQQQQPPPPPSPAGTGPAAEPDVSGFLGGTPRAVEPRYE